MPETVLVCGPNWLGDSVMSMPAVQALRRQWAGARLVMLVKRGLVPLWQLHAAADGVIALEEGPAGTRRTARAVRSAGVSRASPSGSARAATTAPGC